jgi:hypothetical protein
VLLSRSDGLVRGVDFGTVVATRGLEPLTLALRDDVPSTDLRATLGLRSRFLELSTRKDDEVEAGASDSPLTDFRLAAVFTAGEPVPLAELVDLRRAAEADRSADLNGFDSLRDARGGIS